MWVPGEAGVRAGRETGAALVWGYGMGLVLVVGGVDVTVSSHTIIQNKVPTGRIRRACLRGLVRRRFPR